MFERSRKGEIALLIQPHAGGPPDEGSLEEFSDLARSAGGPPAWGWISSACSPPRERSNNWVGIGP